MAADGTVWVTRVGAPGEGPSSETDQNEAAERACPARTAVFATWTHH